MSPKHRVGCSCANNGWRGLRAFRACRRPRCRRMIYAAETTHRNREGKLVQPLEGSPEAATAGGPAVLAIEARSGELMPELPSARRDCPACAEEGALTQTPWT